jgi:MoaA/NifB/PqqE/SkfB family radical SAM enzyme
MRRETIDPISTRAIVQALPRAFDDLPVWGQLNITWRCNLDCSYCTEYDNAKDHVPLAVLEARIDHAAELGTVHLDLIGGEPMLHPDLVEIIRRVRRRGMTTGMTTNGFLLTEARVDELMAAGMGRLQISVDTLKPKPGLPKSLKTLRGKIAMVAERPIWFRVNTVICEETIDEVEQVAELCFELGVGINFSVVHDRGRLHRDGLAQRYLDKIEWLRRQKKAGASIFTPYFLMDYYREALEGRPMDWTCQGGRKVYYVTAEGHFQYCYHVPATTDFLSVTRRDLAGNRGKKGCEIECGVDCVVHTSLPFSNKLDVLESELRGRAGELGQRLSRRVPALGALADRASK